jgi:hypothetical protein
MKGALEVQSLCACRHSVANAPLPSGAGTGGRICLLGRGLGCCRLLFVERETGTGHGVTMRLALLFMAGRAALSRSGRNRN